jgi:hypothetical protein
MIANNTCGCPKGFEFVIDGTTSKCEKKKDCSSQERTYAKTITKKDSAGKIISAV